MQEKKQQHYPAASNIRHLSWQIALQGCLPGFLMRQPLYMRLLEVQLLPANTPQHPQHPQQQSRVTTAAVQLCLQMKMMHKTYTRHHQHMAAFHAVRQVVAWRAVGV
jgi:hypothetical protein